MSRADRRRWKSARTLADLGELVALWLTREVQSLPGYQPRYGPDEETTPLIGVLAACNRAGYVTISSQPGLSVTGADGLLWQQRAAVQGFVKNPLLVRELTGAAERAGLIVVLHDLLDKPGTGGFAATLCDGEPHTVFGSALSRTDIEVIWSGCGPDAVAATVGATQVTLIDPAYGPSTRLWEALEPVVTRPTPPPPGPAPAVLCRECGCTAIDWRVCNDGCSGVLDQADGRCRACIDPSVIIDWSKEPEEKECALCGAPFFHAGSYCSLGCEAADGYSDEDANEDEQPSPAPARPCGNQPDDPWATSPF
ncbi:DUF6919 domain-containing protein [Streptomyces sennicomposti]